jgi:membrane fusion protein (multidrug efflux system)
MSWNRQSIRLQSKAAALAQAKASLVNAKVNLGYTTITSPVNGVIGALPYKLGSLVTSSTTDPLTTVYNTSNIYVYFALNENNCLILVAIAPIKLLLKPS